MSGNVEASERRGAAVFGLLAAVFAIALMERAVYYGIRVSARVWLWDDDLGAAHLGLNQHECLHHWVCPPFPLHRLFAAGTKRTAGRGSVQARNPDAGR